MDYRDYFDGDLPGIERIHMDYNLTDQAYTFHLHKKETELVYVESGKGIYMVNHQHFPVEKGDLLVIEEGFIHAGASSPHSPMQTLVLVVSNLHWRGEYPENIISPTSCPMVRAEQHMPYISGTLMELYHLMREPCPDISLCQTILVPMLILLRKYCQDDKPFWNVQDGPAASDILGYIYGHYSEDITLEHLSQHFYMSTGHISHLLQKEFHVSPINYLIDVRFSKAKALLINTSMSIPDVAYTVGYNNPTHFTKLFIKRIGYSPNDYRILHSNNNLNKTEDTKYR